MQSYGHLALCVTTLLAVACLRQANAGEDLNFDPSAIADPGLSGATSSNADGKTFLAQIASAEIPPAPAASSETTATPATTAAPQPTADAGPAAKPQAGGQDSCCNLLGCLTCNPCPCFYADVEALFLQPIPRFQNQPIVVDPNSGATLQSTNDLNFGVDPGLQVTVGFRPCCSCCGVEFTYWSLFRDTATAVFDKTDPNSFPILPNNFAGNVFVNFDRLQTDYSFYLNSFAVDFPCCCGCCSECSCSECNGEAGCGDRGCAKAGCGDVRCESVEWFAGFNYIDIGNDLNIDVQRNEFGGVEEGNYTIHTENRLFGAQIGGRLRRTVNRFGFELTGAAGIYDNSAEETQTVVDFPNFVLRPTTSTAGDNVAFVGQINLSALFRLTDIWSVKAGYNVIWINGLALAPDQLDFNFAASPSGNQLTSTGSLFLQGANVGLEARW